MRHEKEQNATQTGDKAEGWTHGTREKKAKDLICSDSHPETLADKSFLWRNLYPSFPSFPKTMDQMVRANVHRLVVVKEDGCLDGILSLSDVLRFLIET